MQTTNNAEETTQLITDMFDALNNHDVDALLACITDDCVFENPGPAPDGTRHAGKHEIREFFTQVFETTPTAKFTLETILVGENHGAVMHRYTWADNPAAGDPGSVRGVSVFTIRDGKVAEMYDYVKG